MLRLSKQAKGTLGRSSLRRPHSNEFGGLNISTIGGLIGVTASLALGCLLGNPISEWGTILFRYINGPSIAVVFGGSVSVFAIAYSPADIKTSLKLLKMIIVSPPIKSLEEVIPTIVSFAEKARREGLLALEDNLEELDDDFMRRALQLVIDGTDPELVRAVMEIRVNKAEDRHNSNIGLFAFVENKAPAFGLIGTILGLVQLLANLSDPTTLGPSLAVALITTFYGVIIANAFFGPFQTKLSGYNDSETLVRKLMIEGVLAIQSGDNPRIVEEKLLAFMSVTDVNKYRATRTEPK